MAFKSPRVKNRTYKIRSLELKHLSILPVNSRKRKSTEFISVCSNASFFGYALNEVEIDFVKMQSEGYDKELLEISNLSVEKNKEIIIMNVRSKANSLKITVLTLL